MMRFAVPLLLIMGCLSATIPAFAQEIAFRGGAIMQLAHALVAEARRSNQLPPAYQLAMTNDHTMVITNSNAFELLSRTIATWKETKAFPEQVGLHIDDLVGPAFDTQHEPKRDGLTFAVPSSDIGLYAPFWLAKAEAPGHKLLSAWNFESGYRLTTAQLLVAMAVLIDEAAKKSEFPQMVLIPLIRSPQNWQETHNPVLIDEQPAQPAQPPQPAVPALQIRLNGIEMADRGPLVLGKGLPPFCGIIRVEITGAGPVEKIRLLLENTEIKLLDGIGPHAFNFDSLAVVDGVHTLSVIATDDRGKNYAYIFSFTVMNGRACGFTPAEPEEKAVDAVPG